MAPLLHCRPLLFFFFALQPPLLRAQLLQGLVQVAAPDFRQLQEPVHDSWLHVQEGGEFLPNSVPFSSSPLLKFITNSSSFASQVKSAWQLDKLVAQDPDNFRSHWPKFELSWRLVTGSLIGFLGAALGSVGGIGGGGIFVPMLNLVMGFDAKTSTALSKSMIMGAALATSYFNLKLKHPTANRPVMDYGLAALFQPMLLLGISIGVMLNVMFADWMIVSLLIIIFLGLSWNAFVKGIVLWKREIVTEERTHAPGSQKVLDEEEEVESLEYAPIPAGPSRDFKERWWHNVDFKDLGLLCFVWLCFLIIQIGKIYLPVCGLTYWMLSLLQVPVAFSVTIPKAFLLYRSTQRNRMKEDAYQFHEDGEVEWEASQLVFCIFCGLSAGVVGGLLGVGGGSILGPMLLEIGIPPQAASATATFIMIFSASMTTVEYYLMDRIPMSYGVYLVVLAMIAGFWGQYFVSALIKKFKRPSIIVFVLASTIGISAIVIGIVGVISNVQKLEAGEYMGFESLCINT